MIWKFFFIILYEKKFIIWNIYWVLLIRKFLIIVIFMISLLFALTFFFLLHLLQSLLNDIMYILNIFKIYLRFQILIPTNFFTYFFQDLYIKIYTLDLLIHTCLILFYISFKIYSYFLIYLLIYHLFKNQSIPLFLLFYSHLIFKLFYSHFKSLFNFHFYLGLFT